MTHPLSIRSLRRLGSRFAIDQRGAAAMVMALTFPVLVGGAGLAAEAGYWFLTQRRIQHVADLAAHAAGVIHRSGGDATARRQAALGVATASGYDATTDTLTVNLPPSGGAWAGDSTAVEVQLVRLQPRLLSRIYSDEPVPIGARAVAAVSGGSTACLLALSTTAPGAVTITGSTDVTFDGCDVASNSTASDSFLMSGGASVLSTGCVNTVGGAVATAGLTLTDCAAIREQTSPTRDPYASVAEPAQTGTCRSSSVGTSSGTTVITPTDPHESGLSSMRFCSGLTVRGTVEFAPGLYIISGGTFQINSNALVSGQNVTFFIAEDAELRLNGSATMEFSAPVSGPYSGLLFFGSRTGTGMGHTINGTANSVMSGAIYLPAGDVDYTGNFNETGGGCTQVVASTIVFSGNSTLKVNCQASGTETIPVRETVQLVE